MSFAQAHELSHRMDALEYQAYRNPDFREAINEAQKYVQENMAEIQTLFVKGGKYYDDFAFSDIISALGDNKIKVAVGHISWDDMSVRREIFANLSTIDVLGMKSAKEPMLQKLLEAYRKVVG